MEKRAGGVIRSGSKVVVVCVNPTRRGLTGRVRRINPSSAGTIYEVVYDTAVCQSIPCVGVGYKAPGIRAEWWGKRQLLSQVLLDRELLVLDGKYKGCFGKIDFPISLDSMTDTILIDGKVSLTATRDITPLGVHKGDRIFALADRLATVGPKVTEG